MPSIFALQCQCNDPHSKHEKPALTATAIRALVTVTTKKITPNQFLPSVQPGQVREMQRHTYLLVCVQVQGKFRKEDASNDAARLSSTSLIWHNPDAGAAVQATEHSAQH